MVLREAARRQGAHGGQQATRDEILATLFDKQRDFVLDEAREKTALCPRRAGKTTVVPAYSFWKLLGAPAGRLVRYWGITQDRAYQLMWRPMLRAAEQFRIRITANEDRRTIYLQSGSEVRLVGADKMKEAEKQRGEATILDIVDECSLYGGILKNIAEDVIGPSLMDHLGTVCFMGTPGILFDGYWFQLTGPADEKAISGVSRHAWDVYDNPFMPHARDEIEKERVRKGWTITHPTYLRERRGKWVNDSEGLFYSFDPERNVYDTLPELRHGEDWDYTLGWDIGADDAMALVCWCYRESDPNIYERFSWKKSGASPGEVAAQVRVLENEIGPIGRKVGDTGGGGKVTVNEMAKREKLVFAAAKKTDKRAIVRYMNGDFTGGRVKVKRGSPLADEYATLIKNPDDPETEDPACQNHCADAALYSFRDARHYDAEEPDDEPEVGTKAHFDKVAEQLEQDALDKLEREAAVEFWER